jgi:hypothetical protein
VTSLDCRLLLAFLEEDKGEKLRGVMSVYSTNTYTESFTFVNGLWCSFASPCCPSKVAALLIRKGFVAEPYSQLFVYVLEFQSFVLILSWVLLKRGNATRLTNDVLKLMNFILC